MRRRLIIAPTELAALMNLRPSQPYDVVIPGNGEPALSELADAIELLEKMAFIMRPEVNEERYAGRIRAQEVRKEMLRMIPGLQLNASANYDSNSFVVNENWLQAGFQISGNLVDLAAGPDRIRQAESEVELAGARRMAVDIAVLTQVNVAHIGYRLNQRTYRLARNLADVNERILGQVQAGQLAGTAEPLTEFESRAVTLLAQVQAALAYAELQHSFGRVINAIGLDPLPEKIGNTDITSLTRAIQDHMVVIEDGNLAALLEDYNARGNEVAEAGSGDAASPAAAAAAPAAALAAADPTDSGTPPSTTTAGQTAVRQAGVVAAAQSGMASLFKLLNSDVQVPALQAWEESPAHAVASPATVKTAAGKPAVVPPGAVEAIAPETVETGELRTDATPVLADSTTSATDPLTD